MNALEMLERIEPKIGDKVVFISDSGDLIFFSKITENTSGNPELAKTLEREFVEISIRPDGDCVKFQVVLKS